MTRTELRKSIEALIREYAGDDPAHEMGTVARECDREIDALIARADYFQSQRPEEPGPVYTPEEIRANAGLSSEPPQEVETWL